MPIPEKAPDFDSRPTARPAYVVLPYKASGVYTKDEVEGAPRIMAAEDPSALEGLAPGTLVLKADGGAGSFAGSDGVPVAAASSATEATTGVTATTAADGTGATGASGTGATGSGTASITMGGSTAAEGTGATGSTAPGLTDPGHTHGGATGSEGTGATGAGGTGNTSSTQAAIPENMGVPDAKSTTNVHAAFAANDASNNFPGPFTSPGRSRNVRVTFGAGWDGGNVTVVGTDQFGGAVSETLNSDPGNTRVGVKIFATVTSATKGAVGASGDGASIGTGDKLGLANTLGYAVGTLAVDGLTEAATWDTLYNAVTPTTVPNNVRAYAAMYPSGHTHTGPSHTHTGPAHTHSIASGVTGATVNAHTHTGPSHQHAATGLTATDAGHTHTGPSHTHTGPSHTHTVSVTDPGHVHE